MKTDMLLVFNPKAGKGDFGLNLFEVVNLFTAHGYVVTAYPTQAPKEAYHMVARHGSRYGCVVCAGGDGTLNEAVNGLLALPQAARPAFGYLPAGTTNDFASSLALPKDPLQAARVILAGKTRQIDIGRLNGSHFAYVAAFGMFTSIPYDTSQEWKNVLGHAAYVLNGIKQLGGIKAYTCTVTLDGEEIRDQFVLGIVSNSTSIAGFKLFSAQNTHMDDGVFEVVLLKKPDSLLHMQEVIAALRGRVPCTDALLVRRAAHVEIASAEPLRWTLDGEFGGEGTAASICNLRRVLHIYAPAPPDTA